MSVNSDKDAVVLLKKLASENGLDIAGGKVRRSSSRFCLGVEHGDYNGTELFGVGTDRFIWMAYKPNGTGHIKLFSDNFANDGLIEFSLKLCVASHRASIHAFPIAYVALQLAHLLTQFAVLMSQFADFLLQLSDNSPQRLQLFVNWNPFHKRSTHNAPQ